MQVPVQIDFQGLDASVPCVRTDANGSTTSSAGSAGSLPRMSRSRGRASTTKGGHYLVRIHLALPEGRQVDVDRTPNADERHGELLFAIDDAFNRARRRLQDKVRRMQGAVKAHEGPPMATVARLDHSGDYGFLATGDGQEVYFHRNALVHAAMRDLSVGTRVTFAEAAGDEGPQASTVRLVGKHGMRA